MPAARPGPLLAVLAGAAVALASIRAAPAAPGPPAADGVAVMAGAGCALCHEVPGVEAPSRTDSCTTCHTWIRAVAADPVRREKAMGVFPLWERYERSVATYRVVPSLPAAMARLDPAWVRSYLADPHDLRPGLPETMPRLGLDEAALDAVVATFAAAHVEVPATPAPDPARVEAGRALYDARACATCHSFGAHPARPGLPQAPDLAHARERLDPDVMAAWIRDPSAISPDATMPPPGVTAAEALALRDYLLLADPGWSEAAALGEPPAPTAEAVAWADVEERVFGKICVHCHMDPEQNGGRAGPGNAGGFGWPATGIQLQTYEGVAAVADRLPDALLRRRAEAHRDAVRPGERPAVLTRPEKPGMPLGLPPLSDEDIALVLGWIEQGMPR